MGYNCNFARMTMKLRIYTAALMIGLFVAYSTAKDTGFSTEGIVGWIVEAGFFAAMLGFIANWAYNRTIKK